VFDVHGLIFILAVDYDQLEVSAKALFGAGLRFPDYFRKFVQRMITLPKPDESKLQNSPITTLIVIRKRKASEPV
jgi:KAP family P-loop domain